MFEGFKQLKAFVEGQEGEMLQPPAASELEVLVTLMRKNEEKALTVMSEWTISVGGRLVPLSTISHQFQARFYPPSLFINQTLELINSRVSFR